MWPPPSTPGPFGTSRLWCWRRRSHAHKVNGQDNRSTTKRRRIMWYINTVPQTSGLTKIISANGNLRSSVSLVLSWLLFLDKNSHKHTQCHVQISQSGVIKRLAMFWLLPVLSILITLLSDRGRREVGWRNDRFLNTSFISWNVWSLHCNHPQPPHTITISATVLSPWSHPVALCYDVQVMSFRESHRHHWDKDECPPSSHP